MKYPIEVSKRKIIVTAVVKGVYDDTKLKFILDTGATKSVFDEEAVRQLGYELFRLQAGDRLMTAGGAIRSKVLTLPKFSLMGKNVSNFEVNVIKFPMQISLLADGLLGMDFLLHFKNIKFDFDAKTIETGETTPHTSYAVQVCKHCGCENGEDYVFCKKCGGKL